MNGSKNMNAKRYIRTIRFTGGLLKGLEHTDEMSFYTEPGWECKKPLFGTSPYVVLSCVLK